MQNTYFVSGIDTNCGKTIVTGLLARQFLQQGVKVITQKLVQTGCKSFPDDIQTHRSIMGIGLQDIDFDATTCPYVFSYPASPHLAARLENKQIDCGQITQATQVLQKQYELVLIEGAGGLFVPLNDKTTTICYLQKMKYPLILVSTSKLGSINHTLMSLELCMHYKIQVKALVYNYFPKEEETICKDSRKVFANYLKKNSDGTIIIDCPCVEQEKWPPLTVDGLM